MADSEKVDVQLTEDESAESEQSSTVQDDAGRDALVTNVEKGLADAFGDESIYAHDLDDEDEDKDVETEEGSEDDSTEGPTEDSEVDSTEDSEVDSTEAEVTDDMEAAEEGDDEPSESTLPAAWRRSAISREFTDAEIDDFLKVNPEVAMRTFEKIHISRTAEINKFAELGRRAKEQQAVETVENRQTATQAEQAKGLQAVNVDALVEEHGNEELVRKLMGPINQVIERIQQMGPLVEQGAEAIERSRRETLANQINGFFTGENLKPYEKVYGSHMADGGVVKDQQQNRNKVLEIADAIVAGAALQGRQMSVNEALLMAHDSVASGFTEQVVREKIKKEVKKRADSVTVRPNARMTTPSSGKPRSRKELIANVKAGLAETFKDG